MSAPVTYVPDFLSSEESTYAFHVLCGLAWEHRDTAPRLEYWANTLNRPYTYGRGAGERTYQPQPPHLLIDGINARLVEAGHVDRLYEGCFLNAYRDGHDALGWHADDDPGIDHSRPIAVVTLYESEAAKPRLLQIKSQPEELIVKADDTESFAVGHGSLLLMHAGMQDTHYHRIPKAGFEAMQRISLTYRGLK